MSTISFHKLTKHYGPVLAVDDLSFDVEPGRVTGFLGPNGSGKTSTLRILLGLATATAGMATIDGLAYHQLPDPVRQVGAALDSNTFHPGRSAAQHLRIIATATGLPRRRVDEVLGLTGLSDVAGRRVGGFSLGMRQRLSLAGALLGDPGVLIFDEPLNGLDPDGIRWLRGLLRELAAQDRTVFVSSHLLTEVAQTVDDVIVLARGRLVAQTTLAELVARTSVVRARTHRRNPAARGPRGGRPAGPPGRRLDRGGPGRHRRRGRPGRRGAGLTILELSRHDEDLESLFFDLVNTDPAEPGDSSMNGTLRLGRRAELRKLFTTKALPVSFAIAIVLAIGSVIIDARSRARTDAARLGTDANVYQMLKFGAITCVVMLILGILACGQRIPAPDHRPGPARHPAPDAHLRGQGGCGRRAERGLQCRRVRPRAGHHRPGPCRRTGSTTCRPGSAPSTSARSSRRPVSG